MGTHPAYVESHTVETAPWITFKVASEDWEFEQIFHLNYTTFVEEIPQHLPNPTGILVDRFHDENTYFVCLQGDRLLGMVSVREKRPFSLDQKLEDLNSYLPPGRRVCEIRHLAVDPTHRNGRIMQGLLTTLARHCVRQGYDMAIISGNVRQRRLYERLGFVPFGPLVGTEDALYQPMFRLLTNVEHDFRGYFRPNLRPDRARPSVSLLPGPVEINDKVKKALSESPQSHRTPVFLKELNNTKRLLCRLVRARHVEVLMGTGTLANDVIAGQLSLLAGTGLVLSNGEFGERLIEQARRFRLQCEVLQVSWGQPFDKTKVEAVLRSHKPEWLWFVHCETSTGMLNDLAMFRKVCRQTGTRICVDCVSSIGTVPLDLSKVYLASGVSGKGLGSFSGLSMVFYNHKVYPSDRLPRYLDLGVYAGMDGVPFTISSNLVASLRAALQHFDSDKRLAKMAALSLWLRHQLENLGLEIVSPAAHASPAIITISLPQEISSAFVGQQLEEDGYLLSYNSGYLRARNWIQICLMGDVSREAIGPLIESLRGQEWSNSHPIIQGVS